MFGLHIYSFRFINLEKYLNINDSNHSSILTVLVVAAFTNKKERKLQDSTHTHNLLLNAVEFVYELYMLHGYNDS